MNVADFLEQKEKIYNQQGFIQDDPISIPHQFSKKQDIEISAFFASILAWGQRKTIINKCNLLMEMMDNAPYDFVLNYQEEDLKPFLDFKHRTFNDIDTLYFLSFFQWFYQNHQSLEEAFIGGMKTTDENIEKGLIHFRQLFFSLAHAPERTFKHIATPSKNSACKRINMFLRWMVRKDDRGVDFGIWNEIKSSQLICPLDVHVDRVARKLGLIERKQTDWKTAVELTKNLKKYDKNDPVKYDFSLFGIGVEKLL
ncbi:MAG: TIGR02757 family protein [Cytophagales bacterium]|nr:TIGR02757 family protein [Cytophagales bacterium]